MRHSIRENISRRTAIKVAGAGFGLAATGWCPMLERAVADQQKKQRQCIILWMAGGPSQMDTWDLKPGQPTGGEFQEISTSVPGLKFSEHLPLLAKQADKAGDRTQPQHQRG